MSISADWSRQIAYELSERRGRTISKRLGDGLASMFDASNDGWATDLVHGVILRGLGSGLAGETSWAKLGSRGALLFLILWSSGKR